MTLLHIFVLDSFLYLQQCVVKLVKMLSEFACVFLLHRLVLKQKIKVVNVFLYKVIIIVQYMWLTCEHNKCGWFTNIIERLMFSKVMFSLQLNCKWPPKYLSPKNCWWSWYFRDSKCSGIDLNNQTENGTADIQTGVSVAASCYTWIDDYIEQRAADG